MRHERTKRIDVISFHFFWDVIVLDSIIVKKIDTLTKSLLMETLQA